jgi:spore coat protein SA
VTFLKIALICTEKLPVPPVDGGAVQIYIEGILPYISKVHEITVYCVKHVKLVDEEIVDGVRYIRVDAMPKEIYIENVLKCIEEDYDLVHVFNRPKWIKLVAERLPNTKISLSLHNEMFRLSKICAKEANECIDRVEFINTVSKFIADGVSQYYPNAETKLRVVYSGANTEMYKTAWSKEGKENKEKLKAKYNLNNYKVILFVGRVNEKKGVDILLNAMKIVMQHNNKAALVVIGSKWFGVNEKNKYTEKLEEIAKTLKGPIVFTGFLPPNEVLEHYNLADVFVCPSQWNEPLARVHYEAMASGTPIITTDRGGNAEVVAGLGNGIVIKQYKDPIRFANNIRFILRNPNIARKMGIVGRKLAEEKFNWKRVSVDILNGFEIVNK